MNDRFKFRYWHTKENKYIYTQCDCLAIKNTVLYSLIGKPNKGGWYETDIEKAYNGFELIPEQCTGLSDKNGKLIYEGDLIKSPNNSHKLAIIRMENGVYGCKERRFNGVWEMNLYDLIKHYGVEVIGNIHEQAEQKE